MTVKEKKYKATDKMAEIICEDASLLQVMTRFGMSLGFGDDNVLQVCTRQGVDCKTFLAVINFVSQKHTHIEECVELSVAALLDYLKQSHKYFLEFALPGIRKNLKEALAVENSNVGYKIHLNFILQKERNNLCFSCPLIQETQDTNRYSEVQPQGIPCGFASVCPEK